MHSTVKKIKSEIKNEMLKNGEKEFVELPDGKKFGKKSFHVKLNSEVRQRLSSQLIKIGSFVRFQTNHKDKFIQDSGYVVSAKWKRIDDLVAIYDIVTKSGDQFRIITDPVRYPKDTII
jgi:hypothetical protein